MKTFNDRKIVALYAVFGQKKATPTGNVIKLKRNVISLHPEVHDVASPPALEESPGVWGASKRPSGLWVLSAGGKYRAAGSCGKDLCVEEVSVSRT